MAILTAGRKMAIAIPMAVTSWDDLTSVKTGCLSTNLPMTTSPTNATTPHTAHRRAAINAAYRNRKSATPIHEEIAALISGKTNRNQ
jgi:hypothetical protein